MALHKVICTATLLALLTQDCLSQLSAVTCGRAPLNSGKSEDFSFMTAGVFWWMVKLVKNESFVCGGTMISNQFVLSAANCFSSKISPSDWAVILGHSKMNRSSPAEVRVDVTNITLSNFPGPNVAVLELASKPILSNFIQPICLDAGQTFPVGSTCWGAGWNPERGGRQLLQKFQTKIVNCGDSSSSDVICTEGFTLARGDSGGPLMCQVNGSWFESSVLLFQDDSRQQEREASVMVLTKLSAYKEFLTRIVGPFLSPAASPTTTASATTSSSVDGPAHSSFFIFCHLLVFSVCLQLLK